MIDPLTFTILDAVRGADLAILVIGIILIITLFIVGLKKRRDSNSSKVFATLILLFGCSLSIFQIAQFFIKVGTYLFQHGPALHPSHFPYEICVILYFIATHLMIIPFSMVLASILIIIHKTNLANSKDSFSSER
ncbi:hypothetical protein BSZ32_13250 [Rubritalea profundi]|uniref:Uncharacterized protein n=1 Tax=Rubritalea profundi TaxID=1658618 RepID=A0A2S7U2Y9_9BACT|nr:hypothetical protein BSZ32_13250 [Rubritalea profundi]